MVERKFNGWILGIRFVTLGSIISFRKKKLLFHIMKKKETFFQTVRKITVKSSPAARHDDVIICVQHSVKVMTLTSSGAKTKAFYSLYFSFFSSSYDLFSINKTVIQRGVCTVAQTECGQIRCSLKFVIKEGWMLSRRKLAATSDFKAKNNWSISSTYLRTERWRTDWC